MQTIVREALRKANIGPADIHIVESNMQSTLDDLDIPRNVRAFSSTTSLSGLCELGEFPTLSSNSPLIASRRSLATSRMDAQ